MADLSATFRKPFSEALAAIDLRLADQRAVSTSRDPAYSGHERSFMVAGAIKADLIDDLGQAIRKARSDGTGYDVFKKDFRAIVERNGWHGWTGEGTAKGEEWRMRTIYQTNMRTSYMAGRLAQLRKSGFKFWVYRHSGAAHPRLNHLAFDGIALPPDHPFWVTHYPPNGWGCGCIVEGAMNAAGIRRVGGDPDKKLLDNWRDLDPRTGAPIGIGKGWAQSPGADVTDDIDRIVKAKLEKLNPDVGAGYGAEMQPLVEEAWQLAVQQSVDEPAPKLIGSMSVDLVAALKARKVAPRSAEIVAVPDAKASRFDADDILPLGEWLEMSARLARPSAVLIDEATGHLLFVLPATADWPQRVVEVDYQQGDSTDPASANSLRALVQMGPAALAQRLAGGLLALLLGQIA